LHTESRDGFNLFRVGGIQIAVDGSWLIVFALVLWSLSAGYFPLHYPGHPWTIYWLTGLAATVLFFASVLLHELSHSFVAGWLGQPVRRITLFIFGGMAHLSGEPKSPGAEFKIAAVGPLTSLLLGTLFWAIAMGAESVWAHPLMTGVFRYLAFINAALAVFNLLPGFPLDGGRMLRALFWWRSQDLRTATARAADWGRGIAIGLMVLGAVQIAAGALVGGLWLILIGMFLRGAARAGYYGVALQQTLGHIHVRDIMVSNPVSIDPRASVTEAVEQYFLRYGYAGFPVASDGRVRGLLTLFKVQDCPVEERSIRRVSDIMRPLDDSMRISPSATVSEALHQMVEADTGRLLVMEGDQLQGLITRSVIARFVQVKTALNEGD
jgi:Zn-dependent protease/predicted transcriptional regulator